MPSTFFQSEDALNLRVVLGGAHPLIHFGNRVSQLLLHIETSNQAGSFNDRSISEQIIELRFPFKRILRLNCDFSLAGTAGKRSLGSAGNADCPWKSENVPQPHFGDTVCQMADGALPWGRWD
ncbi:hypothetical protein CDAR_167191 [Caerostris darwini]|uniref:Galectin n=1 Tax=Caerostris darwini TaxID=1538125 RepID=A0AAV4X9L8_9ARAC|nr:hypothetical protein CDAR_167191 [Caerostris darwini]